MRKGDIVRLTPAGLMHFQSREPKNKDGTWSNPWLERMVHCTEHTRALVIAVSDQDIRKTISPVTGNRRRLGKQSRGRMCLVMCLDDMKWTRCSSRVFWEVVHAKQAQQEVAQEEGTDSERETAARPAVDHDADASQTERAANRNEGEHSIHGTYK